MAGNFRATADPIAWGHEHLEALTDDASAWRTKRIQLAADQSFNQR